MLRLLVATKRSAVGILAKDRLHTSARVLEAGKVFRSNRERPLIKQYTPEGKSLPMYIEEVIPEDFDIFSDFMSYVASKHEPGCISAGVTAKDFRPFIERITTSAIDTKTALLSRVEDQIVGGFITNHVVVDESMCLEGKIRDYGNVIDAMEDWIPSRAARKIVGPAYELCNMVGNYIPLGTKLVRFDLLCVDNNFSGHKLRGNMMLEAVHKACAVGIEWGDAQCTSLTQNKFAVQLGGQRTFFIPYEEMFDHGKRIHANVPLLGNSTTLEMYVLKMDVLKKNLINFL